MREYIPLLSSKKFQIATQALKEGKVKSILTEGLSGSDLSINLANISSIEDKYAIVCPDEQTALRLFQELDSVLEDAPINRLFFPASDAPPLDKTSPSTSSISWQISTLYQILVNPGATVLVTSLQALYDCIVPPDILQNQAMIISRGDLLSVPKLKQKLVELGYKIEAQVEKVGDAALRGGIIDFFSPSSDLPYRIEFDVDVIDTIRQVDPETQLSVKQVESCLLLPVSHIFLDEQISQEAVSRIDMFMLTVSLQSSEMRETLKKDKDHISNLVRFTGMEHYTPFFYGKATRLLDYIKDYMAVWVDPDRISDAYERFRRDTMDIYVNGIKKGELLPQKELDDIERLEFPHITRQNPSMLVYSMKAPDSPQKNKIVTIQHSQPDPMVGKLQDVASFISGKVQGGYKIVIATKQPGRVRELIELQDGLVPSKPEKLDEESAPFFDIVNMSLERGFEDRRRKVLLLTDNELFGWRRRIGATKRYRGGSPIKSVDELHPGDLLVHLTFGIGIYRGLKTVTAAGITKEYLQVEYAKGDKLYIPPERLPLIHKYLGNPETVTINKLGGREWPEALARVARGTKDIAAELIRLYARREMSKGYSFEEDTIWQQEMESAFPYEETTDQLKAIMEVKRDLERSKPMDRLVCGDVGYGKTEVAIRAAFKVIVAGKQVAILVPTTILALQHYNTFKERFAPFPIKVEQLSRFKGKTSQKKVVEGITDGSIEMVIGTHRLLQSDIKFKDLGLLIIDEEQRFGVEDKEKIKKLKENIDVLTLTATPIPRTLEMALTGVREISQINSSPEGRKPVKTYVQAYSETAAKEAIEIELARGGQVYYVNNRIQGLGSIMWKLKKIVPNARIAIAHGQMDSDELEDIMLSFYKGEIDVLLCTTIIESGLDIPTANTIIVENAQNLGLAQMYQLRGRVGRSEKRAYAYFFYNSEEALTETARMRLEAIRDFVDLGAGLKIAMRDLEIRGAGNMLGAEQSGHIAAVGYDLYLRLLEDAKKQLQKSHDGKPMRPEAPPQECNVDLRVSGFIPEHYVPDEALRIDCYQRLVSAETIDQVKSIEHELQDRFGRPPPEVESLYELVKIRVLAQSMGINSIVEDNLTLNFHFGPNVKLREDFLDRLVARFGERTTVRPNMIRIRKQRDNPVKLAREFIELACED